MNLQLKKVAISISVIGILSACNAGVGSSPLTNSSSSVSLGKYQTQLKSKSHTPRSLTSDANGPLGRGFYSFAGDYYPTFTLNSTSNMMALASPFTGALSSTVIDSGGTSVTKLVMDSKEFAKDFSFGIKSNIDYSSYYLGDEFNFSRNTTNKDTSVTYYSYLYSYNVLQAMPTTKEFIAAGDNLKRFENPVDSFAMYGDSYVNAVVGYKFVVAVINLQFRNEAEKIDWSNKTTGKIQNIAELETEIKNVETTSAYHLEISAYLQYKGDQGGKGVDVPILKTCSIDKKDIDKCLSSMSDFNSKAVDVFSHLSYLYNIPPSKTVGSGSKKVSTIVEYNKHPDLRVKLPASYDTLKKDWVNKVKNLDTKILGGMQSSIKGAKDFLMALQLFPTKKSVSNLNEYADHLYVANKNVSDEFEAKCLNLSEAIEVGVDWDKISLSSVCSDLSFEPNMELKYLADKVNEYNTKYFSITPVDKFGKPQAYQFLEIGSQQVSKQLYLSSMLCDKSNPLHGYCYDLNQNRALFDETGNLVLSYPFELSNGRDYMLPSDTVSESFVLNYDGAGIYQGNMMKVYTLNTFEYYEITPRFKLETSVVTVPDFIK